MPARFALPCTVGICFALLAGACGGGGGGDGGGGEPDVVLLDSLPAYDGFVRSDGNVWVSAGVAGVGDIDGGIAGVSNRMFYAFDLTQIPTGAEIQSALLVISQEGLEVPGASPFDTHGDLVVDHVDLGVGLDASDYSSLSLSPPLGAISTDPGDGWRALDVTGAVVQDVAGGRTRSDFRLRFSLLDTDNDGVSDYLHVNDGEDFWGSGRIPHLEVAYWPP